jgi:SNF2 family DNA or RNA helicase
LLILDEAQVIKNPNTMAHRIVQQVRARHRLCLTGTPMENHLGELWSLFHFLMPGFLGDNKKFTQTFRKPIEKQQDQDRQQTLTRRVRPFMLRRTKEEVVSELPEKTEIIQHIELLPTQRDLYESVRLAMHSKIQVEIEERGLKRSQIVILDALLKMRQVCCDPRLLKIDSAKNVRESAKLQFLIDTLPEMIEENRKILLFSQFTSMLALIEIELKKLKIPYVILTGQTKDRQTPINDFQSGKVPLFLISLKAGGTGLNLTAADTVIHYDPWWNPAVENQATDRAYRIGQDKPVFVYKLVTVGTVEEKILDMQHYKAALFAGVFDGNTSGSGSITPEDLEALFEPLP